MREGGRGHEKNSLFFDFRFVEITVGNDRFRTDYYFECEVEVGDG